MRGGGPAGPPTGPGSADDLLVDARGLARPALRELVGRLRAELPGHATLLVGHEDAGALAADEATRIVEPAHLRRWSARFGPARHLRVLDEDGALRVVAARPRVLAAPTERLEDPHQGLPEGPVFVGGTGRSGTWALGGLLGAHPRWCKLPTELRFHARGPGYVSVLSGRRSPEAFARDFERRWCRPSRSTGRPKGVPLLVGAPVLRWHLERFVERARDDVPGALAQLLLDIVGPYVHQHGGLGWVETTPSNVQAAATLTTILPTARVVHTVRDGRDVAASVASMPWGPDRVEDALEWWGARLRRAHEGTVAGDPGRVHVVRLEELLFLERERAFDALVTFTGFADARPLRAHFDERLDGARGGVGRWREGLDAPRRAAVDRRYRELLDELAGAGVTCLPTAPAVVDELVADPQ